MEFDRVKWTVSEPQRTNHHVRTYGKRHPSSINTVQFPPVAVGHTSPRAAASPPECACAHSGAVGIVGEREDAFQTVRGVAAAFAGLMLATATAAFADARKRCEVPGRVRHRHGAARLWREAIYGGNGQSKSTPPTRRRGTTCNRPRARRPTRGGARVRESGEPRSRESAHPPGYELFKEINDRAKGPVTIASSAWRLPRLRHG